MFLDMGGELDPAFANQAEAELGLVDWQRFKMLISPQERSQTQAIVGQESCPGDRNGPSAHAAAPVSLSQHPPLAPGVRATGHSQGQRTPS